MSGGAFDHQQFKIYEVANYINETLKEERKIDPRIRKQAEKMALELRIMHYKVHALDYYISGDDDEKAYFEKIKNANIYYWKEPE
jgi:hypothetical protein